MGEGACGRWQVSQSSDRYQQQWREGVASSLIGAAVGIIVSIVGAWRTYRYSKFQIAKRLLEYLSDDKKAINKALDVIITHLRYGKPLDTKLGEKYVSNANPSDSDCLSPAGQAS